MNFVPKHDEIHCTCVPLYQAEVERFREALKRFEHYHVTGRDGDICVRCGLDLRNEVHIRETLKGGE